MHELFLWQNVVFWAPMVVGTLLYALSSLVGGDDDHGDTGIHAETCGDPGHDGSGDAHVTQDIGYDSSMWSYFGLGTVPLATVLASLMFGWGIAGMVLNLIVGLPRIAVTAVIAAMFALTFTRIVTRLLARYVPTYQSYSQGGAALFLTEGEVLYTVSARSGTVRVTDRFNNLRDLDCRVRPDHPPIAKGEKVYVDDYDERSHTYFVKLDVQ